MTLWPLAVSCLIGDPLGLESFDDALRRWFGDEVDIEQARNLRSPLWRPARLWLARKNRRPGNVRNRAAQATEGGSK